MQLAREYQEKRKDNMDKLKVAAAGLRKEIQVKVTTDVARHAEQFVFAFRQRLERKKAVVKKLAKVEKKINKVLRTVKAMRVSLRTMHDAS